MRPCSSVSVPFLGRFGQLLVSLVTSCAALLEQSYGVNDKVSSKEERSEDIAEEDDSAKYVVVDLRSRSFRTCIDSNCWGTEND